jgi:multidrug efflux pump subunit AcrB
MTSAVCALSLSPALCSILLKEEDPDKKPSNWFTAVIKITFEKFNEYFSKLTDIYMEYVKKFVYNKKFTLYFYIGVILLTGLLFKIIPTGFIPDEDQAV